MFTEAAGIDAQEDQEIQVEETQEVECEENVAEEVENDITVEVEQPEAAEEIVEETPADNEAEVMETVEETPAEAEATTEETAEIPRKAVKKSFFVGNVSFRTSQESFEEHCKTYGEVVKCTLMKNGKRTAKPDGHRGFGFVHFFTQEATDKFEAEDHTLDERTWNVKEAKPKTQKFFIAPVDRSVTNKETITAFFSKFGDVQDVYHNVSRGFAFITVVDEGENLKSLLEATHQTIDGKKMECKLAKPRRSDDSFGRGGRGRGRGRGRGGFGGAAWGAPAWGPNPWAMKAMYSPYEQASAYGGYGGYQRGGRGGRRGGRRGRGRNY